LVIDGLQRTANGYATYSFVAGQTSRLNVAHHLHSGEQVVRAAKRHTPVLLLIREPAECALAIVGAWPYVTVGQALRAYTRYYSRVAGVADECVLGFFDEVTSDVGSVISRINERYGTTFEVRHHDEDSARTLYNPLSPVVASRKARAQAAAPQFETLENRVLLGAAQELWAAFQQYR